MGDNGEGRKQDRSYRRARSKCPPNSDVIPGSTSSVEDGWESGLVRTPSLPAAVSVPYLAQSAARAKGRFWKKFLPPPAALCPQLEGPARASCRPPARRRLSERPWPPDRH